jgi:hypothetical protein
MTYHDGLGGPALDCEFVGHLIAIRDSQRDHLLHGLLASACQLITYTN